MSAYTKGPWRRVGRNVQGRAFSGKWCTIADVAGGSPAEADANAALITAAPLMLAVLQKLHPADFDDHPDDFHEDWHAVRAAIKAAIGEGS